MEVIRTHESTQSVCVCVCSVSYQSISRWTAPPGQHRPGAVLTPQRCVNGGCSVAGCVVPAQSKLFTRTNLYRRPEVCVCVCVCVCGAAILLLRKTWFRAGWMKNERVSPSRRLKRRCDREDESVRSPQRRVGQSSEHSVHYGSRGNMWRPRDPFSDCVSLTNTHSATPNTTKMNYHLTHERVHKHDVRCIRASRVWIWSSGCGWWRL